MARQQYKILATIYDKKNRIVAKAINNYGKTHPIQKKYSEMIGEPKKCYLHAEILAIIRARGRGYRIHIERYNDKGEPRLAAPCKACQIAIKEAKIKMVSYTVN